MVSARTAEEAAEMKQHAESLDGIGKPDLCFFCRYRCYFVFLNPRSYRGKRNSPGEGGIQGESHRRPGFHPMVSVRRKHNDSDLVCQPPDWNKRETPDNLLTGGMVLHISSTGFAHLRLSNRRFLVSRHNTTLSIRTAAEI